MLSSSLSLFFYQYKSSFFLFFFLFFWLMFSPCIPTQALVSKTLDQASAQFAASALITTDQLLAFKSKEEQVLASGVNGVLSGAGR